jgi:hypothetical protein
VNRKLGIAALIVGLASVLPTDLGVAPVRAAGGANWKVTVRNDTSMACSVQVWTNEAVATRLHSEKSITPGGSVTFETGAKCPDQLRGTINAGGSWVLLKGVCINGVGSLDWCGAACWNSSFKICQVAGQGYSEVRDNDYSFCKN